MAGKRVTLKNVVELRKDVAKLVEETYWKGDYKISHDVREDVHMEHANIHNLPL